MSVNKAILIGRLGKDVELRYTNAGKAVASFSIATSEQWNDRDGKKQEKTEWHNIVVWERQAEACGQYLFKGSQVYVEGKIATRSYDDKNGVKRYVTEIVAKDVRFLDSKRRESSEPSGSAPSEGASGGGSGGGSVLDNDDIPFAP